MSSTADNVLVDVATLQESMLAAQTNASPFVSTANPKFKDFNDLTANLGDSVQIRLPYRFVAADGLVVVKQPTIDNYATITVNNAKHVNIDVSAQQYMFNTEDFMDNIGLGAVTELGGKIEQEVASLCETVPFRIYGNGIDPINQFNQLGKMLAEFRSFGMPRNVTDMYLLDTAVPDLVGSGLAQYAPNRNEKMANSWEVADFDKCSIMDSNLLPLHVAGTVGQAGTQLTVVSVLKNASGGVYQIVLNGAPASDALAVVDFDKGEFVDGVSGKNNVRFRTFTVHAPTSLKCQFNVLNAHGGSNGSGEVTLDIDPPLQSTVGQTQNVTTEILPGMKVFFRPSARYGMVVASKAMYVAMPQLPEVTGFPSASAKDQVTGVSTRFYYGDVLGQNQKLYVYDAIWAQMAVSSYVMGIAFPA